MSIPSEQAQATRETTSTPPPTETLADIEQDVVIDVPPKKVIRVKGKFVKVPRQPPELGLSEIDLAGLSCEGNDE